MPTCPRSSKPRTRSTTLSTRLSVQTEERVHCAQRGLRIPPHVTALLLLFGNMHKPTLLALQADVSQQRSPTAPELNTARRWAKALHQHTLLGSYILPICSHSRHHHLPHLCAPAGTRRLEGVRLQPPPYQPQARGPIRSKSLMNVQLSRGSEGSESGLKRNIERSRAAHGRVGSRPHCWLSRASTRGNGRPTPTLS